MKMRRIPEDAVCVICGKKKDLGRYGDTEIYVCFDCYTDTESDKFRKWLDERGLE